LLRETVSFPVSTMAPKRSPTVGRRSDSLSALLEQSSNAVMSCPPAAGLQRISSLQAERSPPHEQSCYFNNRTASFNQNNSREFSRCRSAYMSRELSEAARQVAAMDLKDYQDDEEMDWNSSSRPSYHHRVLQQQHSHLPASAAATVASSSLCVHR
jgi:hypothetical protein